MDDKGRDEGCDQSPGRGIRARPETRAQGRGQSTVPWLKRVILTRGAGPGLAEQEKETIVGAGFQQRDGGARRKCDRISPLDTVKNTVLGAVAFDPAPRGQLDRKQNGDAVHGQGGILEGGGKHGEGFDRAEFALDGGAGRKVLEPDGGGFHGTEIDRFPVNIVMVLFVVPDEVAPACGFGLQEVAGSWAV